MSSGLKQRLQRALIPKLGGAAVNLLMGSTRREVVEGADVERTILFTGTPVVYVLWHGRLLPCSYNYRNRGFGTMITRNRDGDYITGVIEGWGYHVIRGSSSRGGATALREVIRYLRSGRPVALTPDGPRGPRQKMKLGPLQAAQIAGVPIVPISAGATRAWYFGRWDRFLVPKPFTWMPVGFAEPIEIERRTSPEELPAIAAGIETRLNELTERLDRIAREGRSRWRADEVETGASRVRG